MPSTTPADVRSHLIDALQLDLIGPAPDDEFHAAEVIPQPPSKWYLTGFLVPYDAPVAQRSDDTGDDELDAVNGAGDGDDEAIPEKSPARKGFFPSSMGVSLLVSPHTQTLQLTACWGDYVPLPSEASEEAATKTTLRIGSWQRIPCHAELTVPIQAQDAPLELDIPDSKGLKLLVSVRSVSSENLVPAGTRSVSIFLVNQRRPAPNKAPDAAHAFQTSLTIQTEDSLVPRPDLRGGNGEDWDESVADLQYRDDYEFAVGHNVSAIAVVEPGGICRKVWTAWIPTADVEKVIPTQVPGVELRMENLAAAPTPAALRELLHPMVDAYATWIIEQRSQAPTMPKHRAETAKDLLNRAVIANQRIAAGLQAMSDPLVFEAFCIANRSVARAIRQRLTHDQKGVTPESLAAPKWRPFQLAFLLMNIVGIANPEHGDSPSGTLRERELVDLLFFPTGGGKTEAYLGLAAFTLVLRRLRNSGIHSAGLSVLMRYTLRLLTLDQLGRAATLICALELERQDDVEKLGKHPFEIGLWVGQAATPNKMGKKGDNDPHSARTRTIAYQNNDRQKPSPIPLENCPWCGTRFTRNSFELLPDANEPNELRVRCISRKCQFNRNQPLPILTVDDQIYRRLPCFIIATVDKFASLPWVGETGALFGQVERFDQDGFYGPCKPGRGQPLSQVLPPPDLIIQDELHLISGPLGTMVGLYETAIDALSTLM
ncbi:hypothetical protein H6F67_26605 [Microcoleus sp. FACHB-1515]|uniref:hypothetical protein n=1 Tax=Cyanophyceae TaxID=3028117 RepID=UPI001682FB8D|nr:hypothetical protein [Microcoleus sp. FACHB-1515]MBD2093421.1 hypothetical protein [Microcoleus sp. FACHB-1515]